MTRKSRQYLMCRPEYFDVSYTINAWMNTSVRVDRNKACAQWEGLRSCYEQLGHTVHTLDAIEGLPDLVFSANGAFSVDGIVYGAKFKYPQRTDEAQVHEQWYAEHTWKFVKGKYVNEGEGDFTFLEGKKLILAGYGFRTELAAHAEAQAIFQHQVVSLRLVDERFYHLDTALFVLDEDNICYYPEAFSNESRTVLEQLFPDAIVATEVDALAFGLNSVSDGNNVVMPIGAEALSEKLTIAGYSTVCIELSELLKGGGSVKCCTAELRGQTK